MQQSVLYKLILPVVLIPAAAAQTSAPQVGVAPQYDSTHVYVAPGDAPAFAKSFLATFGGTSSHQVVVTVTPSPGSTTSQLLQTPSGTVSLFGFLSPIPFGFGDERNGYLVKDLAAAITAAQAAGADVLVAPFRDAIGRDAIVEWPGGVKLQLYWHSTPPNYPALRHVPDNRVYVSADRADAFVRSFLAFSQGNVMTDEPLSPGEEIGLRGIRIRRIAIESVFGRLIVFVTDGHLPYPYGRETTGFEVDELSAALERAKATGAKILVAPLALRDRESAMVLFPGNYVAEIHATRQ